MWRDGLGLASNMISPPTDRLHKFLSIGGISLILIGVMYPLGKYNEVELQRINTIEKMDETKYAHDRFAQSVKEEHALMDRFYEGGPLGVGKLKSDISKDDFRKAAKEFYAREPEVRKLEKEMYDALIQYKKNMELTKHYENMKKLWFSIGAISLFAGSILTFIGFRQWLSQPKSSR